MNNCPPLTTPFTVTTTLPLNAPLGAATVMLVLFQTLTKEPIAIPLPLADFAAAYDKIK